MPHLFFTKLSALLTGGLFIFIGVALATAETALVTANTLTLREKEDSKAKAIESLNKCDMVEVKSRKGDWAEVVAKSGNAGWVLAKYLTRSRFVTVAADEANVRQGPADSYDVIMKFNRDYPLEVQDGAEGWLKVIDVDGDRGWISAKLVAFEPCVITKKDDSNVREAGSTEHPIVFTTQKGVILRVLEEKDGWLKVKHRDGDEGWISAKIVFGWIPSEPEKPAVKSIVKEVPQEKKKATKSSTKKTSPKKSSATTTTKK